MSEELVELRSSAGRALAAGDLVTARRAYLAVRALLADRFGDPHEHVAAIDDLLGGVERAAGDRAAARAAYERARAVFEARDPARARSIETTLTHLDPLPTAVLAGRPGLTLEYDGRTSRVENDLFFIGRGYERVHLYIPSPWLSRVHARVVWEGGWVFEDCRSENGSFLAGAKVDRRVIEPDDRIELGVPAIAITARLAR